ncbi:unnamed protein product, partial [Brenthis ino]
MENAHKIKLSERLSSLVRPRHYQLNLNPNLETGLFHGEVIIDINDKDYSNYQLELKFTGNLTRYIIGFYLSNLKNKGAMVTSKFQPTYARQAFPCFDEPEFKATYDITSVKPLNYVALSNMNEAKINTNGNGLNFNLSNVVSGRWREMDKN